ncbi:hypothetical protein TNCV_551911 [Trichonephila clavipes]|nr:hypothetical protein TNCV_551911 [Trichonephila clavipes]
MGLKQLNLTEEEYKTDFPKDRLTFQCILENSVYIIDREVTAILVSSNFHRIRMITMSPNFAAKNYANLAVPPIFR